MKQTAAPRSLAVWIHALQGDEIAHPVRRACEFGKRKRRSAVAAEGGAEQREQRLVLHNRKGAPIARRPPLRREGVRKGLNLADEGLHRSFLLEGSVGVRAAFARTPRLTAYTSPSGFPVDCFSVASRLVRSSTRRQRGDSLAILASAAERRSVFCCGVSFVSASSSCSVRFAVVSADALSPAAR
jgi:hypothetical protein